MLRAIIADDEELSIKRLVKLLGGHGGIELCGTFLNPMEALEYANSHPFEVAFLDISMPEINGLNLASHFMQLESRPAVVFVTGHDEFALQAFDVEAVDYLTKPVTAERLARTINKLERLQKPSPPSGMLPRLSLFGGFRLTVGGEGKELKLRSPKTEELLAFLVSRGAIAREEAAEALWGGLEGNKAFNNLNTTLYYVRKALQENGLENCITAGKNEIRIESTRFQCDVLEFEELLRQSRTGRMDDELITRAELLYAGEFLKGRDCAWAVPVARRLEKDYIRLQEAAADWYRSRELPLKQLRCLSNILQADGFREDIHASLIRLYLELGRKNEAVRQYETLEQTMIQELGVDPDPELKRIVYQSLQGVSENSEGSKF